MSEGPLGVTTGFGSDNRKVSAWVGGNFSSIIKTMNKELRFKIVQLVQFCAKEEMFLPCFAVYLALGTFRHQRSSKLVS